MVDDASTEQATAGRSAITHPYVVAIGASAGALEALRTLFGGMPAECGAAVVVVVGLPRHESRFVELLQPYTELPVRQVIGTAPLEPGCVLVIPPGVQVSATGSHLRITHPAEGSNVAIRPIDHVFETLADAHGNRSIGVVLTGTGDDGAEGIRRIKDRGGVAIVQEGAEAAHDGMLRSAIHTGAVDLVLPLRDITRAIVRYCRSPLESRAGAQVHATVPRLDVDARSLHFSLLDRYAPASVLVDAQHRVLNHSMHASRYVRLAGGDVMHDLIELVAEPLRSAVRTGLELVAQSGEPWTSKALVAHTPDGARRVVVHVDPVDQPSPADGTLVVFEERERHETSRDRWHEGSPLILTAVLRAELDKASRRLRTILSNSHGETKGKAENGQADLVSAIDDIEIAKEEVQTVNDELYALHRENRSRLDELGRLSNDLTQLLESTGLATLFLDRELEIVRCTPPVLEIFEVRPTDQGRPLAEVRHILRDAELVADAARVLERFAPVEREVEAENGKAYLLRIVPYGAQNQVADGVAITLVDITTRKKAEQELRDADRRKDEFIALLAHELRNPLAPISAGIEILKRKGIDSATAERVTATMSRQAAQLVRLIDDLLDVSRISSGRLELRKAPVLLADIMRDAVATVRPLLERLGHALIVDAPAEPIMLDADAARLAQVLANLLNNAARYTPRGGRIELTAARSGNNMATIRVQDNGYGIDEGALPHVFEMFYQGNDPRSQPQSGLGIGLALARSLVAMHGGTIEVASAGVDCGSEFTLRLPVLTNVELPDADATPSLPLGRHRVLVVDDNADAARTLAMLIESLGEPDVHVAFSGAEALPLAERIKPDTVFLDLKMADMDGYEVAQRLRQEPWAGDAWLVALTGWGLDEHKRRTKDAGFDQHLTKPANRAELEAILARSAVRH